MILGIDFDGTMVEHEYPKLGPPVPGAIEALHEFISQGHKLILWTMRSGEKLNEAIQYFDDHGIELYGINKNPEQINWTKSPKAYCHRYIDDAAVGCPLIHPSGAGRRPYVDWTKVKELL